MKADTPTTTAQPQPPKGNGQATPPPEKLELSTLKDLSVSELTKIAKSLDVPGVTGMR